MSERRGWHLLKAAHKALYDEHWPRNLRLEASCLRSSESDCAVKRFNSLPASVKSCPDFNTFSKETHKILKAAVDIA